jgi:putative membrane protein
MRRLLGLAAFGTAVLTLPAAFGDTGRTPITDAEFVQKASAAGLDEVNIGKMVLQRANRDDVKNFARRLVDDHTKANAELNRIADSKHLVPSSTMDAKHQELSRQLMRLSGADFDRQFIQGQLKDHEMVISLFENESKNGKDEQLKAFATKTLPTLREHLQIAQKLAGKEGTATPTNTGREK